MRDIKIKNDVLLDVFKYASQERHRYRRLNIEGQDLRILMPSWLSKLMIDDFQSKISNQFRTTSYDWERLRYMNAHILPHYQNEVVLYCVDWHFNPDMLTPVIFKIQLEP